MFLKIEVSVNTELKESEITVTEGDKELGYIRFNRIIRPSESVSIGKIAELFAKIYNAE